MAEKGICSICGLPSDLCTCQIREREERKIKIYMTKRRFGKPVTIIEGVDKASGKSVTKKMKRKLACGGSFKDGHIELQGKHVSKARDLLLKLGFEEEMIETE